MFYNLLTSIGFNYIIGIEVLIIALATFALTVIATRLILPVLRAKKLNQPINMYVMEHAGKAGTPTMGGIGFIIATMVVTVIWLILEKCGVMGENDNKALIPFALTILLGVGNALIGFFDDYKKLVKKQNEGLSEIQKLILQVTVAAAYLIVMGVSGNLPTALKIPFINFALELGWFAYPIYLLGIVGFVNSTNITDGIDGLASSVGVASALSLIAIAIITGSRYTGVSSALLLGALLGFLVFNHYPAKVFMGDTGSLFIGGIIMGCAVSDGLLLPVIIISLVFILEMFSSLWQKIYYKLTKGKRFFKKAPIHHTFQHYKWSENQIVLAFFAAAIVFGAVGVLGAVLRF